jgi:hypothetical protein
MYSDDSFTDYDQLNYLVRVRIAEALELKNKSKSLLYQQIIEREKLLRQQWEKNSKLLVRIDILKNRIIKLKKHHEKNP